MEDQGRYKKKGRKKVSLEESRRYKTIRVYFSKKEYEKYLKKWEKYDLNHSDFLKQSAIKEGNLRKHDRKDYHELTIGMKRIGNNLNQISRKLNENNSMLIGIEGKRYFKESRDYLRKVMDALLD